MTSCDTCFEYLDGAGVLKQPCGHRIHKKCESEDGKCSGCKLETVRYNQLFYVVLAVAGLLIGFFVGIFAHRPDIVYQSVRDVEHSLLKMEQFADRSISARVAVAGSLNRIKRAVDMEMTDLLRGNK